MKVTKQDLAKLIQEELDALLSEEDKVISGTDLTQTGGAGVYGGTEGKPITRKQAYDPPESWRDQLSRAIWGAYLPLVGTAMPGDAPLASRYGWVAPPVSRPRGEEIAHPGVEGAGGRLYPPTDPYEDPTAFIPPGANPDDYILPTGGYRERGLYEILIQELRNL